MYNKEMYESRKANHQCVVCGCDLNENIKGIMCEICKKITHGYAQKTKQKRRENRCCTICGKKLQEVEKHVNCLNCRWKARERYKRKKKYTGEKK